MPQVVAVSDIPTAKINQRGRIGPGLPGELGTTFLRAYADAPDGPTAVLNRYEGASYSAAHFHEVDQFQVIIDGKGEFGRHHVSPYYVHFSRAYTPYGPLRSDKETGWAFIVLRARFDPGAQRFPEALDELKQIPNRRPWQVTAQVTFPSDGGDVSVHQVAEISGDKGLFTHAIMMSPGCRTMTPHQSGGDGQYVVVVRGSLIHENARRDAPTVIFVKRDEPAFCLQAGPEGLQAIIMNFPEVQPLLAAAVPSPAVRDGIKTWQCHLCSFTYDESAGLPAEGIAAGTRWADVPETWTCPDCSAAKSEFEVAQV